MKSLASRFSFRGASLFRFAALFAVMTFAAQPTVHAQEKAEMIFVKAFGAVGNGLADDTAAIQKAVNEGRGGIHFGKGIYRLTQTVVIDLDRVGYTALMGEGTARIVMAGAGPAFKFVGTHAGSADPPQFKTNVWERQRMPMVDRLEIIGAHDDSEGIMATGTMQFTVTRTTIRLVKHGIHLVGLNRNIIISDCHIYHNRGIGVFYDNQNLHQSNIVGSHISYCGGGGVVSRGGNVRNLHITGCDIESNHDPKGPPTANVLIDSTGGSIGEVAITGCSIQHNSPSPDSANIRILGQGTDATVKAKTGSDKTQEGNITITGNVLSDVQVNIHIVNARGVTLQGNTFWMGYQHDLLVENSTAIVMGPNNLDRSPRYLYGTATNALGGVVFRNSEDCTITGLHVSGVWRKPAAVLLEKCNRFNIADCSILDSDGVGLMLSGVTNSRIAGCVIRDDRKAKGATVSIRAHGGTGNWILHNRFGNGQEIGDSEGKVEGNW